MRQHSEASYNQPSTNTDGDKIDQTALEYPIESRMPDPADDAALVASSSPVAPVPSLWAEKTKSGFFVHGDSMEGISWPERLTRMAEQTSTTASDPYSEDTEAAQTIHHYLDAIESVLRDPRAGITHEITKSRPQTRHSGGVASTTTRFAVRFPRLSVEEHSAVSTDGETLSQLTTFLNDVSTLNGELDRRRKESGEIHELFEGRCRGLSRTIAELEDEVLELRADLMEDGVELEGIRGTVHGLQGWIDGLQEEQRRVRAKHRDLLDRNGRRRLEHEWNTETDAEVVLDGIVAWMRGWRDVEEGFRVRAQARKTRREKRRGQIPGTQEEAMVVTRIGISGGKLQSR